MTARECNVAWRKYAVIMFCYFRFTTLAMHSHNAVIRKRKTVCHGVQQRFHKTQLAAMA